MWESEGPPPKARPREHWALRQTKAGSETGGEMAAPEPKGQALCAWTGKATGKKGHLPSRKPKPNVSAKPPSDENTCTAEKKATVHGKARNDEAVEKKPRHRVKKTRKQT